MGGNAIKNSKRMTADQYEEYVDEIYAILHDKHGIECDDIVAYQTKDSFGDIDILVIDKDDTDNWVNKYREIFNPPQEHYTKNSGVYSFEYKGVQVDLIRVPDEEHMIYAAFYFSYNDLGNLLGRFAEAMGLKFGHDGLWMPVYDPENDTHLLGEILLSLDKGNTLVYLGCSTTKYRKGFRTLEDIFDFVIESTRFNPELYPLEHRSHTARVRDKKRKTYTQFLTYLDTHKPEAKFGYSDSIQHYQAIAIEYFEVQEEYQFLMNRLDEQKLFKKFYNGHKISEMTGLTHDKLGDFMKYFNRQFGVKEELMNWVVSTGKINPLFVDAVIEKVYSEYLSS